MLARGIRAMSTSHQRHPTKSSQPGCHMGHCGADDLKHVGVFDMLGPTFRSVQLLLTLCVLPHPMSSPALPGTILFVIPE